MELTRHAGTCDGGPTDRAFGPPCGGECRKPAVARELARMAAPAPVAPRAELGTGDAQFQVHYGFWRRALDVVATVLAVCLNAVMREPEDWTSQ